MNLIKNGNINNRVKTFQPGKSVVGFTSESTGFKQHSGIGGQLYYVHLLTFMPAYAPQRLHNAAVCKA